MLIYVVYQRPLNIFQEGSQESKYYSNPSTILFDEDHKVCVEEPSICSMRQYTLYHLQDL